MTSDLTRSLTSHEQKFVRQYFAPRPAADVPASDILDSPTYVITVNAEWLPHILGALSVLDQADAWLGSEADVEEARSQINIMIASIAG